jgi:alpha-tubulin suppressor-like RCC1 family protein
VRAPGPTFRQIDSGLDHTCGLDPGGSLYCWGQNARGQLGDGTLDERTEPVLAAGGQKFVAFAAGWQTGLAVTRDGSLRVWGRVLYSPGPPEGWTPGFARRELVRGRP